MSPKTKKPRPTAYRACVGIMVFNRDGRVWVGQRVDMPGDAEGRGAWWQMPQGGIDDGENARAAAFRELEEETGIVDVTLLGEADDWLTYDLPEELIGVAWKGRYCGQKQRWFAVRYDGPDHAIVIDPPADSPHKKEFEAWKWIDIDELVEAVVPFKRDVYRKAIDALRQHSPAL
ncbi:MAG: RNA pyrophosphohydrolase [Pseudomonadota bacterium]